MRLGSMIDTPLSPMLLSGDESHGQAPVGAHTTEVQGDHVDAAWEKLRELLHLLLVQAVLV